MKVPGRAAIVTGGGRGIGRAITLALAREGADVAINYRRDEGAANETIAEVEGMGRKGIAVQCDVTDWERVQGMVADVAKAFGKIDILVNSAGIVSRGAFSGDTEVEELHRVIDTHVFGTFHFVKACLPHLRKNPRSDIHVLSSMSPHLAPPGHMPYAVAKAAEEKMAEILAKEERRHNVRVNTIACGVVQTEMGVRLVRHTQGGELDDLTENFPFGRICQPEDVANLSLFLLSEEGSYMSGHVIFLDGSNPYGVAKEQY